MTAPNANAGRTPGPVRVRWTADSEHVEGTSTHALLVVPDQPGSHRAYFVSQNKTQLAQLCAVVFGLAIENGVADLVMQIVDDNRGGSFRVPMADQEAHPSIKPRTAEGNCPHCGREVPARGRDATFSACPPLRRAVRMSAPLVRIVERITIEQVRAAPPAMIYYGANTCWWTHDSTHVHLLINRRATPHDVAKLLPPEADGEHRLPCDPRGGMLLQTDDVERFLVSAEAKAAHYGRHGLRTFIASHHLNSQLGVSERPWCASTWEEYNAAIDRAIADGRLRV